VLGRSLLVTSSIKGDAMPLVELPQATISEALCISRYARFTMAQSKSFCPDCGHIFSERARNCPDCGRQTHKSVAEAYQGSGLGLFDLVPGIRDLPHSVRYALMLVTVSSIVGLMILGPTVYKLFHQLYR
jgi:hypothetical protein